MNPIMMAAFLSEMEKIALEEAWSLGPQRMQDFTWNAMRDGAADGIRQSAEEIKANTLDRMRNVVRPAHQADRRYNQRVQSLLDSGELNPQTHYVDRATGDIRPKSEWRSKYGPAQPSSASAASAAPAAPASPQLGPQGTVVTGVSPGAPTTRTTSVPASDAATQTMQRPVSAQSAQEAATVVHKPIQGAPPRAAARGAPPAPIQGPPPAAPPSQAAFAHTPSAQAARAKQMTAPMVNTFEPRFANRGFEVAQAAHAGQDAGRAAAGGGSRLTSIIRRVGQAAAKRPGLAALAGGAAIGAGGYGLGHAMS